MTTQHGSAHVRPGAALLSVMLLAVAQHPAFAAQSRNADPAQCSVRAETPRRLELADGRTVSVDVQSVAVSGGTAMAVGRHAYVFPRSATPVTPPIMRDSIIGIVTDERGNTSLVPNPLRNRRAFFPRVAAGGDGSFHVVFVTASDSAEASVLPLDTATIWYARFVNGAWISTERVGAVRQASLRSESASNLLERAGDLSFLFPFLDRRSAATSGGVVLLRRMGSAWSADTLRTHSMPKHVRAVYSPGNEYIVAGIVQAVPRVNSRSQGSNPADELYLARFDSAWREPRRAGGDGRRTVSIPVLATAGETIVASWISWRPLDHQTSRIEWLRVGPDGRPTVGPTIDSGSGTFPFEMIGVDNRHPLWLYHGDTGGAAVALVMASDSGVTRLASLTTPFENPKAVAIAMTPTRVLVFTMQQGKNENEPMVASYKTALEIRCPSPEQR